MTDPRPQGTVGRRDLLVQLAGIAISITGLSGFRPFRAANSNAAPVWDDRFELAVDLEIASQEGFRYHRPYVAVWVENSAGKPIRTLSLWVNTTGRGPRYIHELRRWWNGQDTSGPDLTTTVSSATRMPGQYSVVWNGRDDRGQPVQQGTYRLVIEAAREHGSYGVMQQDVVIAAKPVSADVPGNDEIRRAHVEYRRRR